jgi:hypothetical protein
LSYALTTAEGVSAAKTWGMAYSDPKAFSTSRLKASAGGIAIDLRRKFGR